MDRKENLRYFIIEKDKFLTELAKDDVIKKAELKTRLQQSNIALADLKQSLDGSLFVVKAPIGSKAEYIIEKLQSVGISITEYSHGDLLPIIKGAAWTDPDAGLEG